MKNKTPFTQMMSDVSKGLKDGKTLICGSIIMKANDNKMTTFYYENKSCNDISKKHSDFYIACKILFKYWKKEKVNWLED